MKQKEIRHRSAGRATAHGTVDILALPGFMGSNETPMQKKSQQREKVI